MADITLFPQPARLERIGADFSLAADARIIAHDRALGEILASYLRPATGFALPVQETESSEPAADANVIILEKMVAGDSPEAYSLVAGGTALRLQAADRRGFLHGFQTIRQLLPRQILAGEVAPGVDWRIPGLELDDEPAFGWRGLHLDVGRHFFPLDFIKQFIDMLAFYKFNIFHWHLTEDQGWRIEIQKYPLLTEIGGFRSETIVGNNMNANEYDGQPYGGFYTQAEIREAVDYAGARGITIVPEIEMPGHAVAALTAYPALGCRGEGYEVRRKWGIAKDIFCAGNDEVFVFLENVLDEVLALFPSEYIHIGGDEAPKDRWKACQACQARIQAEGLADERELQSWFIRRIESWLNARGRKMLGWDEILEGGLAPNATVMSWRGSEGGIAAANAGHDVVMTPNTYCYLDYYQSVDTQSEPLAIPSILPLRQVWDYVVIPPQIDKEKRHHILGGQGNIWTEYMPNSDHVEYMMFPRAIAIADVLWHHPQERDYAALVERLQRHLPSLDTLGVNYRRLDEADSA
ncbi:MAG: beta-N-acetylhexosaminidase [Chloroflexi bacterium]|nr:beta-N-acetylhexosaminidase [Chloroflexota bacterium]MCY4248219.1 beta-N-acetylhexosaminidase [Chloroflexota bacterium]